MAHETNNAKDLNKVAKLTDAEITIVTTALDTTASILEEFTNVTDEMTNVNYHAKIPSCQLC